MGVQNVGREVWRSGVAGRGRQENSRVHRVEAMTDPLGRYLTCQLLVSTIISYHLISYPTIELYLRGSLSVIFNWDDDGSQDHPD